MFRLIERRPAIAIDRDPEVDKEEEDEEARAGGAAAAAEGEENGEQWKPDESCLSNTSLPMFPILPILFLLSHQQLAERIVLILSCQSYLSI